MDKKKKILYVQYTNPCAYPPLEHSASILLKKGWEVLFLGTESYGSRQLNFQGAMQDKVRKLNYCSGGGGQKLHFIYFHLWVLVRAIIYKPNWIYISNHFASGIAMILKMLGFKVIYHEHDSPQSSKRDSLFLRLIYKWRTNVLQHANMIIFPQRQRLELALKNSLSHSAQHQFCVWNCPSKEEMIDITCKRKNDSLVLYFHGSVGPSRLPLTVLDAVSSFNGRVSLWLTGYFTLGHVDYKKKLEGKAKELRLGASFKLFPPCPTRKDLINLMSQADIGLSFMPRKTNDINLLNMAGASNKPFEYLSAGLPLLVSNLPDWEKLFVESGYGLACDPNKVEDLEAAIGWFLKHPDETRRMAMLGREKFLKEWNYEYQFQQVIEKMN